MTVDILAAYTAITQGEPQPDAQPVVLQPAGQTQSAYAEKALQDEVDRVAAAVEGERNETLNESSFSLGTLIGAGILDENHVESALMAATTLSEGEAKATIRSGINAGKEKPRQIPELHINGAGYQHGFAELAPDRFPTVELTAKQRSLLQLLIEQQNYTMLRHVLSTMSRKIWQPVHEMLVAADFSADSADQWLAKCTFQDGLLSQTIEADLAHWGYSFAEDETDSMVYVNGKPIDDAQRAEIRMQGRDDGYGGKNKPLAALDEQILVLARRNRFHPVRDWLAALTWDGQKQFEALTHYFMDKHEPIVYDNGAQATTFAAFLARWMLGCCARAMGNIDAQNPMLVIGGAQGIGKSYFAKWLCSEIPSMFIEQPLDPHSADHARLLASRWIWEVGELGATVRRADREALKRFLTQTTTTFRVPYAKDPVTKPVLASFLGTLNNEVGFLTDPTGSRRFLSVELDRIDQGYSKAINVAQLWAEMAQHYRNGQGYNLAPVEAQRQQELNEASYITTDTHEALLKYYDMEPENQDWWEYTVDIVQHLNSMDIKTNTTQVGVELRQLLGYVAVKKQIDGRRGKGFYGIRCRMTEQEKKLWER